MISFPKKELGFNSRFKEWIIANGLGGYSSSTIINLNTRKYHGLLVSYLNDEKYLMLSKVEETLHIGKNQYNLGVNQYNTKVEPVGYKYLENFNFDVFPQFIYKIGSIELIKSIVMVRNYNAIVISYLIHSPLDFRITIRPFLNYRNIHALRNGFNFRQNSSTSTTIVKDSDVAIILGSDKGKYKLNEFNIFNVKYEEEKERGYEFMENYYSPGEFYFDVKKGMNKFNLLCVADYEKKAFIDFNNLYSLDAKNYEKFFTTELLRIQHLVKQTCYLNKIKKDKLLNELITASDSFIVEDGIMAGYHWFNNYNRDCLISLSGLCLITGRIDDAKSILLDVRKKIKNGVISSSGTYPSADTSLWFIYSIYKFYKYTKNIEFIKECLWDSMKEIITAYRNGTDYGIKIDDDYLISLNYELPLTWMDTRYTLRNGKNVEINSLWYNALKIMEYFGHKFSEDNSVYFKLAENVKLSFNKKFWNGEYLLDNLDSKKITCNQLFAIALPFRILPYEKELKVLKLITDKLLTPFGIRSLDSKDNDYKGNCFGNQDERDASYHNGTSWSYLLGFYVTAYIRLHNDKVKAKKEALNKIIYYISEEMKSSGIGTLSEIYDGNYPHVARGCISQAWSVAELLRCYVEDILK